MKDMDIGGARMMQGCKQARSYDVCFKKNIHKKKIKRHIDNFENTRREFS